MSAQDSFFFTGTQRMEVFSQARSVLSSLIDFAPHPFANLLPRFALIQSLQYLICPSEQGIHGQFTIGSSNGKELLFITFSLAKAFPLRGFHRHGRVPNTVEAVWGLSRDFATKCAISSIYPRPENAFRRRSFRFVPTSSTNCVGGRRSVTLYECMPARMHA